MLLASLFLTAIELTSGQRMLLMFPLCLAIAVVHKTLRCNQLKQVPKEAAVLWVTIIIGMYAVGISLWLIFEAMT